MGPELEKLGKKNYVTDRSRRLMEIRFRLWSRGRTWGSIMMSVGKNFWKEGNSWRACYVERGEEEYSVRRTRTYEVEELVGERLRARGEHGAKASAKPYSMPSHHWTNRLQPNQVAPPACHCSWCTGAEATRCLANLDTEVWPWIATHFCSGVPNVDGL